MKLKQHIVTLRSEFLLVKSKIKACPLINTGLHTAFKHTISFATVLAANFGCNQFRIMPEIVAKLMLAAQCPMSPLKWLCCSIGIWFRSAALHSTKDSIRKILICFYVLFLLGEPINDWKIEQNDGLCFGC